MCVCDGVYSGVARGLEGPGVPGQFMRVWFAGGGYADREGWGVESRKTGYKWYRALGYRAGSGLYADTVLDTVLVNYHPKLNERMLIEHASCPFSPQNKGMLVDYACCPLSTHNRRMLVEYAPPPNTTPGCLLNTLLARFRAKHWQLSRYRMRGCVCLGRYKDV